MHIHDFSFIHKDSAMKSSKQQIKMPLSQCRKSGVNQK